MVLLQTLRAPCVEVMATPESECDEPEDDAYAGFDVHPDELGVDDPDIAPHELMSFAEMVKITSLPMSNCA